MSERLSNIQELNNNPLQAVQDYHLHLIAWGAELRVITTQQGNSFIYCDDRLVLVFALGHVYTFGA
jgi:hypothetical protein